MRRLWWLAACALVACDDTPLAESQSAIYVCEAESTPPEDCNRPIDLGRIRFRAEERRTLWVLNRGAIALEVSSISGSIDAVKSFDGSLTVPPGARRPVGIGVTPPALGPADALISFTSNDEKKPTLFVMLEWRSVEPRIELCPEGGTCGTDVTIDFGAVRRSQQETRRVTVKNVGTSTLSILAAMRSGTSTAGREFSVVTSTRSGTLYPGTGVPVLFVYTPMDGGEDAETIVFESDDPLAPAARARLRASSSENAAPRAKAAVVGSSLDKITVPVGTLVALDGAMSMDAEGDPLSFAWALAAPQGSSAAFADASLRRVTFVPDRAGRYDVSLVVTDSLMQASLPSRVQVDARPINGLHASVRWTAGGDLDLHLVREGGTLFGEGDCYFDAPSPSFGDPASTEDDPRLLTDTSTTPGLEDIVIAAPAAGTYRIYVHYFEALSGGASDASVDVLFDDGVMPGFTGAMSLPAPCALWHVGDAVFPEKIFVPSADPLGCR